MPDYQARERRFVVNEKNKKEEAKKRFSRRHETSEEHLLAHSTYLVEHGKQARQRKADTRQGVRDTRTLEQQLAKLDQRLGVDQGAAKERTRLAALIKS